MAKMSYSEQLRHPNWQRRRLEVMEEAGFECENCGDKETTLNVHHRLYVKGRMVWEYGNDELACLCEHCHRQEHGDREQLDALLAAAGVGMTRIATGLLAGYLSTQLYDVEDADALERQSPLEFIAGSLAAIFSYRLDKRVVQAIALAREGTILNPAEEGFVKRLSSAVGDESA